MTEQQDTTIFGIDLGTTYSCIAYVDEFGKPVVAQNMEGHQITPSVVLFEGESRVVGDQAKETAVLYSKRVVEMVKRHMGEAAWRFSYEGKEYTPEEISSYVLRKVVGDAAQLLNRPITDVVITCPAYFGIAQREATAKAGEIAGLKVWEIINEPTAAALDFGLHEERDQVVLVYDLGGGTFDITMIEIKGGEITVIATGGDHVLGGRDWDSALIGYLVNEWLRETGSSENPTDSDETLQDLWQKAEKAKMALSSPGRSETKVVITHAGQRAGITLTREKFDELTADLLEKTIQYTKSLLIESGKRGYTKFDQLLLVGGSTRMLQVKERLTLEFGIEPRMYDPDQAVAKGAAVYGQTLAIGRQIRHKIAEKMGVAPEEVSFDSAPTQVIEQAQHEVARASGFSLPFVQKAQGTTITNVVSHSFGLIVLNDHNQQLINNLVLAQEPLPRTVSQTFKTVEANQESALLEIMENISPDREYRDIASAKKLGDAELSLPAGLPKGTPVEVTFELNQQGRLHVIGRGPGGRMIETTIQTSEGISEEELKEAKARSKYVTVS